MMRKTMPSVAFNASAVKKLLLGIRVSDETGELLGVPPAQLEKWVRQLAVQLEDGSSVTPTRRGVPMRPCGGRLSAEEIHVLLDGYAGSVPEYA